MTTRINKDTGIIEESDWGICWDPKRDDNNQMTRVNTDSGAVEESGWGILWDDKRDGNDNITRVNTETGDVEHSHHGIFWGSESKKRETSSSSGGYSGVPSSSSSDSSDWGFMILAIFGMILFILFIPFVIALFFFPTWRAYSLQTASSETVGIGEETLVSLPDMYSRQCDNVGSLCLRKKLDGEIYPPIFQDVLAASVVETVWLFLGYLYFR
ncbi:MAG: hypothetical protein A2878_03385 [Candidatus Moranbacteria bacterium RIFCSPHIGHO2_01_FULL_54_31]|nr:MAG: hypothetical protein A2878_03385 [Candidatus Moranbacteria bacterium RIFCSPHIGHO2_01_FULL_54_31]